MLIWYIRVVSVLLALMGMTFATTLVIQYRHHRKQHHELVYRYYQIQSIIIMTMDVLAFVILLNNYSFSRLVMLLFIGQFGLLFVGSVIIERLLERTLLPLWSISQFLLVISFIVMTRLNLDLGMRQLIWAAIGYGLAFIIAGLYRYMPYVRFSGFPAILLAVVLLLMANTSINGATNWLQIGNFSFQPSEIVKVLYCLFLASLFSLFKENRFRTIIAAGIFTITLIFIQVFQNDLGSALIYYVMFILMCYVFSTNRMYIIGGGAITLASGYLAWLEVGHVRVRIEAWLNPWLDIDGNGYQIAQSLFAIGNGGLTGTGITLGRPEKIPEVITDFIYAAIVEEMGLLMAFVVMIVIVMFILYAIHLAETAHASFDYLLVSGLVIVYGFQSFLIIGGVTKLLPLTGVTLPFVSYGGSSLVTTLILLGFMEGVALKQSELPKSRKDHQARNKPLRRVRLQFLIMFMALAANLAYYSVVQAEAAVINDYNPRLAAIEAGVIRGDILDRNNRIIATSRKNQDTWNRYYPYNHLFAHTVGYTGSGKTGLEAYHNLTLIRSSNNIGDTLTEGFQRDLPKGNSVVTTLDYELQHLARELLGDKRGAVVAMDPKTGQVLAAVSAPDFDPNRVSSNYDQLIRASETAPLLNRATQGLYPPGSTYKTITTIAYLEENRASDFFHYCEGEAFVGQKVIHCYNNKAHGRLDLGQAFAMSCNTAYGKMAEDLSPERLRSISEQFLFNSAIDFELPVESSRFVLGVDSTPNERVETVIGQGETMITPLNNALIACAIANEGQVYKPFLTKEILDDDGTVLETSTPEILSTIMTPAMADTLEGYMTLTTESGTAKSIDTGSYEVASKTGSAENPAGPAHAWYIGYAPVENPQIALAIIVENVGSSSVNAVPIADRLYAHWLK